MCCSGYLEQSAGRYQVVLFYRIVSYEAENFSISSNLCLTRDSSAPPIHCFIITWFNYDIVGHNNNNNNNEVALTKNAITHLFSRIEYHLSNQVIESLNYPGQATTMLGLLKYPVKGTFSFRIPMKHIFGFVRTMTKLCMVWNTA